MTDTEKIEKIKKVLESKLCIPAYKVPITQEDFNQMFRKELTIDGISSNLFSFLKIYEALVAVVYEEEKK